MTAGMESRPFELSIPMAREAELVAARAVEQIASGMQFEPREIDQIRLALIEACINAFEHSADPDQVLRLCVQAHPDRITITVRDFGRGFDPRHIPEPVLREKLQGSGNRRGWGLMLMRRMMDEVEYEPVDVGTCLRLVKYCCSAAGGQRTQGNSNVRPRSTCVADAT
jgi:serine/threonine-protein kinase RsbW